MSDFRGFPNPLENAFASIGEAADQVPQVIQQRGQIARDQIRRNEDLARVAEADAQTEIDQVVNDILAFQSTLDPNDPQDAALIDESNRQLERARGLTQLQGQQRLDAARGFDAGPLQGDLRRQEREATLSREDEVRQAEFENVRFLQQLNIDATAADREDRQAFDELMRRAAEEFQAGQLNRQLQTDLFKQAQLLGFQGTQSEFDRTLQRELQQKQLEHDTDMTNLAISAEQNNQVWQTYLQEANNLAGDPTPEANEARARLASKLQSAVRARVITPAQADSLNVLAGNPAGLARQQFESNQVTIEAQQEELRNTRFMNRALERRTNKQFGREMAELADGAAKEGNQAYLDTLLREAQLVVNNPGDYSQEEFQAASELLERESDLRNRAVNSRMSEEEYRKLTIDQIEQQVEAGKLANESQRLAFFEVIAGRFESLEDLDNFLANDLSLRQREELGGDQGIAMLRQTWRWQEYIRGQALLQQEYDALVTSVDLENPGQWKDRFVTTAISLKIDPDTAEQIADGILYGAQREDQEIFARIGESQARTALLVAQAEDQRQTTRLRGEAAAGGGGIDPEMLKQQIALNEDLLNTASKQVGEFCNVDAINYDPAQCSAAQQRLEQYLEMSENLARRSGLVFPSDATNLRNSIVENIVNLYSQGFSLDEMKEANPEIEQQFPGLIDDTFQKIRDNQLGGALQDPNVVAANQPPPFGNRVFTAVQNAEGFVNSLGQPVTQAIGNALSAAPGVAQQAGQAALQGAGQAAGVVGQGIVDAAGATAQAGQALGQGVAQQTQQALGNTGAALNEAGQIIAGVPAAAGQAAVQGAQQFGQGVAQDVVAGARAVPRILGGNAQSIRGGIEQSVPATAGAVQQGVENIIGGTAGGLQQGAGLAAGGIGTASDAVLGAAQNTANAAGNLLAGTVNMINAVISQPSSFGTLDANTLQRVQSDPLYQSARNLLDAARQNPELRTPLAARVRDISRNTGVPETAVLIGLMQGIR